jgi:hypothetical protein
VKILIPKSFTQTTSLSLILSFIIIEITAFADSIAIAKTIIIIDRILIRGDNFIADFFIPGLQSGGVCDYRTPTGLQPCLLLCVIYPHKAGLKPEMRRRFLNPRTEVRG